MKEVTMFECEYCRETHTSELLALQCEFKDKRTEYANKLLSEGWTIDQIEYSCGFHWSLKEEHKKVTKDSCFAIPHWQCCDKPAYRITRINKNGSVDVFGIGGWGGGYGNTMSLDNLGTPHDKSELFVCGGQP